MLLYVLALLSHFVVVVLLVVYFLLCNIPYLPSYVKIFQLFTNFLIALFSACITFKPQKQWVNKSFNTNICQTSFVVVWVYWNNINIYCTAIIFFQPILCLNALILCILNNPWRKKWRKIHQHKKFYTCKMYKHSNFGKKSMWIELLFLSHLSFAFIYFLT